MTPNEIAETLRERLKLEPNQTCGFVRNTYSARLSLRSGSLEPPLDAARPLGTALYFMVTREAPVRLHRIQNDQLYHFYLGDPLKLILLHSDRSIERVVIGPDLAQGQFLQFPIPGGTFHTARLLGGGNWFLGGSTEWPGVIPADVEIGDPQSLAAAYPDAAEIIHSIAATGRCRH